MLFNNIEQRGVTATAAVAGAEAAEDAAMFQAWFEFLIGCRAPQAGGAIERARAAPNSRFDGIMFLAGSRMYGTCL
jgi:hypothetical protein